MTEELRPGTTLVGVVIVCEEGQVHWSLGVDPARCDDETHVHRRIERHRHRTAVRFPDGTEVIAVSFDATEPYSRDSPPDYGLYLDARWEPPWAHGQVEWPNFAIPTDAPAFVGGLDSLLDRARAGQRGEIGCLGGHGRTGTALAVAARRTGVPAEDAVSRVRTAYCPQAVETADQERFVAALKLAPA